MSRVDIKSAISYIFHTFLSNIKQEETINSSRNILHITDGQVDISLLNVDVHNNNPTVNCITEKIFSAPLTPHHLPPLTHTRPLPMLGFYFSHHSLWLNQ